MSNNPLTVDIKNILVAGGIGVYNAASGWSIVISGLQDEPNTMIALHNIGGVPPEHTLGRTDNQVRAPEVRMLVRAKSDTIAWQKADEAARAVERYDLSSDIGSYRYGCIEVVTEPIFYERDNRERIIYLANFRAIRQLTT